MEQFEQDNEKVEEDIKQRILSEEATKLLDEIDEMTAKRNEILVSSLKLRKMN